MNTIEVPFKKLVEIPVAETVEIPVERLVQQENNIQTYVDVPLPQEVIKEIVEDVYEEKVYHTIKTVYKPKFIPKYVDRYEDKIVDVRVEVPKLVFRNVFHEEFTDKNFESKTLVQRLHIKGENVPREMNTKIIREKINENQKKRFEESSQALARTLEENVKVKAQLDTLKEIHYNFSDTVGQKTTEQLLVQMRNQVASMESSLQAKTDETERLRNLLSQEKQIEQVTNYDQEMLPQLKEQIRNIREHNDYLQSLVRQGGFKNEVFEAATELMSQQMVREAPVTTRIQAARPQSRSVSSYGTGSYSGQSSRSVSPVPRYTQPITTSTYQPSYPKVARQSSPAPQRVAVGNAYQSSQVYRPVQVQRTYQPYSRGSGSYYSSGESGSNSSYSSRSVSPIPVRVNNAPSMVSNTSSRPFSKYQREIDSVVNKTQRPLGPTPLVGSRPSEAYSRQAADFMVSGRSPQSTMDGKPVSSASTSYPHTLNNTGRLIGDFSMVNSVNRK